MGSAQGGGGGALSSSAQGGGGGAVGPVQLGGAGGGAQAGTHNFHDFGVECELNRDFKSWIARMRQLQKVFTVQYIHVVKLDFHFIPTSSNHTL